MNSGFFGGLRHLYLIKPYNAHGSGCLILMDTESKGSPETSTLALTESNQKRLYSER